MERLEKVTLGVESAVRLLVVGVLAFMLGTVLLDVLARNTAIRVRGLDELARYSLVWIVFLVTAIGARHGDLLGMDAVANLAKGRAGKAVWLLRRLLFLVFLALMAWFALDLVRLMIKTGRDSANLGIPLWFVYAPIMLGSFVMLLSLLADLILRVGRGDMGTPTEDSQGHGQWN